MKKNVKIVKQVQVQNGAKDPVDIKRKLTVKKETFTSVLIHIYTVYVMHVGFDMQD